MNYVQSIIDNADIIWVIYSVFVGFVVSKARQLKIVALVLGVILFIAMAGAILLALAVYDIHVGHEYLAVIIILLSILELLGFRKWIRRHMSKEEEAQGE